MSLLASTDVETKACTRCGETKELDGFGKHPTAAGGRQHICRSCQSIQQMQIHAKAREEGGGVERRPNQRGKGGRKRGPEAQDLDAWAEALMRSGEPVPSAEIYRQAEERGWSKYQALDAIRRTGAEPSSLKGGAHASWQLPEAWRPKQPRVDPMPQGVADQLSLMGAAPERAGALKFLPQRLAHGPVPRAVLAEEAKELGITDAALARAASALGLVRRYIGVGRETEWSLPQDATKRAPSRALTRQEGRNLVESIPARRGPPEVEVSNIFEMFAGMLPADGEFDRQRARHELLREMVSNQHAVMMELLRG